jgi:hypothetical protein
MDLSNSERPRMVPLQLRFVSLNFPVVLQRPNSDSGSWTSRSLVGKALRGNSKNQGSNRRAK